MDSDIYIYNAHSRITPYTLKFEKHGRQMQDIYLFIYLPSPLTSRRMGRLDFEFLRTIISCPPGTLSESRAELAMGLTQCRTSVLVTNDPALPSLAAVCLQAP
jgi:hypothetical protein